MKMKYFAALSLLVWLGVTGWLASMVITKPAALRQNQGAEETAAMAELRASVDRNKRMRESIAQLGEAQVYQSDAPLVAVAAPRPMASDVVEAALPPPSVSLVLTSAGSRTAFVNGEQVRAGQRLSTGGRVRAIGPDWVRIDDPVHGNQTYRVPALISNTNGAGK